MLNQQLSEAFISLRNKRPLVHHITNYVTVNDCANITLCIGGAPVMADAHKEVAEMVSMAGSLVLNIGTLNDRQVESMMLAGKKANERGIPIVLDPVGAGATRYRTETVHWLMDKLDITIIKGNAGEIGVLAGTGGTVRGVDSGGITGDPLIIAKDLARSSGSLVIISGATDIVSDSNRTFMVDNGHELMGKISGTGCMASSIVAAFAAVTKRPDPRFRGGIGRFRNRRRKGGQAIFIAIFFQGRPVRRDRIADPGSDRRAIESEVWLDEVRFVCDHR